MQKCSSVVFAGLVLSLGLLACGDDDDAGGSGGTSPGTGGTENIGGSDGGTSTAGGSTEGGASDGGTSTAGGSTSDGGISGEGGTTSENACALAYAGCDTFEDHSADAEVTISFGGELGASYSPQCLKVNAGTTITFEGSFAPHPLTQACGPADFPSDPSLGSVTLTVPGIYGYYCENHGSADGSGMAGAIEVVP